MCIGYFLRAEDIYAKFINNDFYEKGILNTGELLDLRIKVAGYTSESGTMTVVFPIGVSSTKIFDVLCNN